MQETAQLHFCLPIKWVNDQIMISKAAQQRRNQQALHSIFIYLPLMCKNLIKAPILPESVNVLPMAFT